MKLFKVTGGHYYCDGERMEELLPKFFTSEEDAIRECKKQRDRFVSEINDSEKYVAISKPEKNGFSVYAVDDDYMEQMYHIITAYVEYEEIEVNDPPKFAVMMREFYLHELVSNDKNKTHIKCFCKNEEEAKTVCLQEINRLSDSPYMTTKIKQENNTYYINAYGDHCKFNVTIWYEAVM